MSQKIGRIKVGSKTGAHAEWLKGRGYECAVEGDHLNVQVTKIVGVDASESLDLSENGTEVLKGIIERREGIAYSCRIRFADGKVLFGVPACTRLGKASALVMKPARAAKQAATSEFDAL